MSRRAPWGANIARAVSGDPYMELPEGSIAGESCAQALVRGGHDWTVSLHEVQVAGGAKIDGKRAVIRDDTGYPLGVVGKTYQPIFNRELAAFSDELHAVITRQRAEVQSRLEELTALRDQLADLERHIEHCCDGCDPAAMASECSYCGLIEVRDEEDISNPGEGR